MSRRGLAAYRTQNTLMPSGQTHLGKMLRWPLKAIPRAAVVPILSGPARGLKWVVGASIHGCWLGIYESTKQKRFAAAIRPRDVVYDLGAQAGFYSLLASRLVGPQGAVYAFEPLPRNVGFLQRHIKLNGVANINVFELAIGGTDGTAQFADGPSPLQGSLSELGPRSVRVAQLDTLFSKDHLRPPKALKIDIEGGGLQACLGARKLLEIHKPVVFLAIDADSDYECCDFLRTLGYQIEEFEQNEIIATTEALPCPSLR
jgi:FkbM family methyltransferase